MAEKDEKKAGENKEEKSNDPNEKVEKKSRLVLFAGIGGVLLAAFSVGGFFIFKTISGKKHVELSAQGNSPDAKANSHGAVSDKKDEKKDEKKDDQGKKEEPKKEDSTKKDDGKKDENGAKKEEPKGTANFGDTFMVPRMDLNLGNSIENRFIRIAIAIEYRGGENQGFELKRREAQIRDIVITSVTNKTRISLISDDGKENLRREILNKINEVTDRPVQNVYFTEFFVE